jgi:hypothetical protein
MSKNPETNLIINQKYLTKAGDPVIFLGEIPDGFKIKVVATGHEVEVKKDYKFYPWNGEKVNGTAKNLMKSSKSGRKKTEKKPKLAHKIDKYLFLGKYTVKEIAEKIKSEPEAKGKDLEANVHARLVGYRRKGIPIQKSDSGKIKVVLKA